MSEKDLGYLMRAVEDLSELVQSHMDREEKDRKDINQRLKKIEDELNVYKTVYRGAKWIFALILLIITLKFGDIPRLFGK